MSGLIGAVSSALGYDNAAEDAVSIVVNGAQVFGWLRIDIDQSVELMPWSANFETAEQGSANQITEIIKPGAIAQIYIGKTLMLTGYVMSVERSGSSDGHLSRIEVRSKSIDLVDCAAEFTTYMVTNTSVFALCQRVAKPFGIDVYQIDQAGNVDIGPFGIILTEPGYEVIERITRLAACLFYDRVDGNITLAPVSTRLAAGSIAEGKDVEAYVILNSQSGRYSKITALLPAPVLLTEAPDADDLIQQLTNMTTGISPAIDPGITRHRPMLIPIEVGGQSLNGVVSDAQQVSQQRVLWECARRYGRSQAVEITVSRWRDDAGALWAPNTQVHVSLPSLSYAQTLSIVSVRFRRDESGTHADLVLMPPQALAPEPIVNPFLNNATSVAVNDGQETGNYAPGAVQQEALGPVGSGS